MRNFQLILIFVQIWSVVLAAKERKLRSVSMTTNDVVLSSGISCIQIEWTITCYGVNANRSVIHFINKQLNKDNHWSSWNMFVLEDSIHDIKLDGISCVNRKNMPKCYLRMINVGFEHLIEVNPSKDNWYKLCDNLATKPQTMLSEEMNINIISRTIKNEFYHKYADNKWHLNKFLPEKFQFSLIGEANCVNIDKNNDIICFSRTDIPTKFAVWSRDKNHLELIDNQKENPIKLSSDLSCISMEQILCFVVNENENIYRILCDKNLICSKWILINSKINSFRKIKPIPFIYNSSKNIPENIGLYALTNDGLPYIITCQECLTRIDQWSDWMELTSKPLSTIETIFYDFQSENIFLIGLTNQLQFTYSIFHWTNHTSSSFDIL